MTNETNETPAMICCAQRNSNTHLANKNHANCRANRPAVKRKPTLEHPVGCVCRTSNYNLAS
jgi:hypothetical protein